MTLSSFTRLLSAPQRWPLLWTATCALPCCHSSPNALLCLPAAITEQSWSTPCCIPFIGCHVGEPSPKPRETSLRSASWHCASKSQFTVKFSIFLHHSQIFHLSCRHLRPSMLQHLLRRLVFDVPILNEYAKMPLKVRGFIIIHHHHHYYLLSTFSFTSHSFWQITMNGVGNITASPTVGPTLGWRQKKSFTWLASCFGEFLNHLHTRWFSLLILLTQVFRREQIWVCVSFCNCRNLMQRFSRFQCHVSVPLLEPSPQTM